MPEDELVARLLARGRSDDTEDVIRRRQQVYRDETSPLLDHYRDRLVTVDAIGAVEEITDRVTDALRATVTPRTASRGLRGLPARGAVGTSSSRPRMSSRRCGRPGALVARTLAAVTDAGEARA